MCIISADAANCYDRVHHGIMALVFAALGVNNGLISEMLHSIQPMKFFLCTGWGESYSPIGGNIMRNLHELCQGNGASPAVWIMISSVFFMVYKNLGFGSKVKSPMTLVLLSIMGVLFVDDKDLYIMSDNIKTQRETWEEAQRALTAWGEATHSIQRASQARKVLLLSDSIRVEHKRILGLRGDESNRHPSCTAIKRT